MCCRCGDVLLVHGSCVIMLEAGGCVLCARDAGGYAPWLFCMLEAVAGEIRLLEGLE